MLFNDYLLPFEILSVLLLVAMVGVILLSKKDLK
jgi:NADH-quinone oxidoreductase subunit J